MARHRYNIQELKKARPELRSLEKSGGEGSFGLVCCLDRADRTGEGGLTGGSDGDQREFDLEIRVTTNGNLIIPEMFHSCALNK